jgi:glycosyltransferase involved in cell wall biosynthesis
MIPHLLFAIHYLELGGAERSLIGLLRTLDYSKLKADLFVYSHRGELMKDIPPEVNLLPEIPEYAQIERPMKDVLKDGYWRIVLARLKAKRQFANYRKKNRPKDGGAIFGYVAKNVTPLLPNINPSTEYDLAVSFLAPHDIVLEKVRAKKKVCWVHTDYSEVDIDTNLECPVWSRYDHVAAVSDDVAKAFIEQFPSLSEKVVTVPNIIDFQYVKEQAGAFDVKDEMPRDEGVTNLLSVGRFTEAKNFDNVPDICRHILETGVPVRWYLIGFGGDEALIRKRIADAGVEKDIVILGKKDNPYPYMRACDLYVQPSRYEGCPITIREAQSLGKPVVATDFHTVKDVIVDGENGFIVPLDNDGCAHGIVQILREMRFPSAMKQVPLDNLASLLRFYSFI